MDAAKEISKFSPFPILSLHQKMEPQDGLMMDLSETCRKNYQRGAACQSHYQQLMLGSSDNKVVQCPFGFSSISFSAGDARMAITGFIPFPRIGGEKERIMARRHPENKVSFQSVTSAIKTLTDMVYRIRKLEDESVLRQSMALHEIRKLNRTVVQMAERYCWKESPADPEAAPLEVLNIWKAAELMSKQFEVIEILANESLAALPFNATVQPYRIFDKCVRVFRTAKNTKRIVLTAPYAYSSKISACDKTFPIIPTVLIGNALKYSTPDSEIKISLDDCGDTCLVTVASNSYGQQPLDERVFQRGFRASRDGDGSGNGLYVAQLIAGQHQTRIHVESKLLSSTIMRHLFRIGFKILRGRGNTGPL